MNKWKYEINIKQHLIEDGTFEDFALSCNKIAAEFRKLPEDLLSDDFSAEDAVDFLESCCAGDEEYYSGIEEYINEINYNLNTLYDFADRNRVWCGLQ